MTRYSYNSSQRDWKKAFIVMSFQVLLQGLPFLPWPLFADQAIFVSITVWYWTVPEVFFLV